MGSVAGAEGDPDAFEFFEETDEDLVPPREDPGGADTYFSCEIVCLALRPVICFSSPM